jgi:purine-binding chemotaxis protein CheW
MQEHSDSAKADAVAKPAASALATSTASQYLTFDLAGETFAIPILAVQEIRGWEPISRTPRAPDYVLGVMNLRGAVVPILDLRIRLGMPAGERTATSVVIVVHVDTAAAAAVTIGCLVDAVSDVVSVEAQSTRPTPSACGGLDAHFLSGMATIDQQLVMLLDLNRLVETSVGGNAVAAAA